MAVCGLQGQNVFNPSVARLLEIRSPLEALASRPVQKKIRHGAGEAAIPVWKGMDVYQSMMKPRRDLLDAPRVMFDLEMYVLEQ
jgi:hypothetical protein